MSTTIVAVVINLLATLLPLAGINLGDQALTTTVQTLIAIVTGLWIWFKRYQVGDITVSGVRK